MHRAALWLIPLALIGLADPPPALAQVGAVEVEEAGDVQPFAPPEMAQALLRALEAPYLTEEEGARLRVHHGVWRDGDLEDPALRAKAALLVGAWDDESLSDPAAAPEDRAEAALLRGDPEIALDVLAGRQSARARRIRAAALEDLGRLEEADAAIDPLVNQMLRTQTESAELLVEGVRALWIRANLRGQPASDYRRMMELLGRARNELDRLNYDAAMTEARLLYAKDNRQEAAQAATEALTTNPALAEAWWLLGRLSVDGFNFDRARSIALSLDRLAQRFAAATGSDQRFSPHADLILAAAWLRQNEPDLAGEELSETLARYPKKREALAIEVAISAVQYEFEETERLLAAYEELSPGSADALFAAGEALSENRQYEPAAGYLERAAERRPNWPPPLVELGLLELQSGRDDRALRALRGVAQLDPFNTRAANSLFLLEELLTYDVIESPHFRVRYKPGVDRVMAEDMLAPLEEIHRNVAIPLDHEPDVKTTIELMPNHEWFAVRITGMPAIHTIAAATGPVIAMEAPKTGPRHTGVYDWKRVIQHEYTHTVTLSRTNNRIPHWFTEAAAVHMEQAPRDYSTCLLLSGALESGELFDLREINIAFVRPKKRTDRSQAYAQGHWMYEYIMERWGPRAPLELMDLYAEGLREAEAMRSVLGISQEDFLADFTAWAEEQARSWGMLAEPNVGALRLADTLEDAQASGRLREAMARMARDAGIRSSGAFSQIQWEPPLVEVNADRVAAWLEDHPRHPDLLDLSATFALRQTGGDVTPAMAPILERWAEARPVDPSPHRHLARLHLGSDDPEQRRKAIPHLEYLDAREQKTTAYAVELAKLLRGAGNLEQAKGKADRATQIAPFDADHRELAATVALESGDLASAERHIAALVELEPERTIHQRRLEAVRQLREKRGG